MSIKAFLKRCETKTEADGHGDYPNKPFIKEDHDKLIDIRRYIASVIKEELTVKGIETPQEKLDYLNSLIHDTYVYAKLKCMGNKKAEFNRVVVGLLTTITEKLHYDLQKQSGEIEIKPLDVPEGTDYVGLLGERNDGNNPAFRFIKIGPRLQGTEPELGRPGYGGGVHVCAYVITRKLIL